MLLRLGLTAKKTTPPSRLLYTRQAAQSPPSKKNKQEWVVARSLCHYRLFDLSNLPLARREDALKLKIRQWSPFSDYQSYIVWHQHTAQVWVWDKNLQQTAMTAQNLKASKILPETLLRPPLSKTGVQLIQCLEGFEGQYWREGILWGSRWWPQLPTLSSWAMFQRSYGLAVDNEVPQPITSTLLNKPWGRTRSTFSRINLQQHEYLWVFLGGAILLTAISWQIIKITKWQQALTTVQQKIDALNQEATPILTAKTNAVDNKQAAEKLYQLDLYPSQLALLAKVAKKLPERARLLEWDYQWGQLRITVEETKPDPRKYVQMFELLDWFKEVRTEMGRKADQLTVEMQLVPRSEWAKPVKEPTTQQAENKVKLPPGQQSITTKIDIEEGEEFDWSKVPVPDFSQFQ